MSESFAELFEESLQTIEMAPGSIVTGTVVEIDDDWVVVHAGLKSEGVIPKSQFLNEPEVVYRLSRFLNRYFKARPF